jgi:nucleolin
MSVRILTTCVKGSQTSAQQAVSSFGGAAAGGAASGFGRSPSGIPPNTANIAPSSTLYVGNLFFEVSEEALERQFAHYGPIKKTRIIFDHRGLSKG